MNCKLFTRQTAAATLPAIANRQSPIAGEGGTPRRSQQAFTVIELLVATCISVFVLASLMISFIVISNSFDAIGKYSDLDRQSRNALDTMSRDIRQAAHMTNWTTTGLWFTNVDGSTLNYTYATNTGTLSYTNGSTGRSGVLLSNCTYLAFSIFQRTPTNGPICFYTASNAVSAKGILMSFTCVKTNYLGLNKSESIETASVVMRN